MINGHKIGKDVVSNRFNEFITSILYCLKKGVKFQKEIIFNKKLILYSKGIQFSDFGSIGCKQVIIVTPLGISGVGNTYIQKKLGKKLAPLGFKMLSMNSTDINDEELLEKLISTFLECQSQKDMYYIYIDASLAISQLK